MTSTAVERVEAADLQERKRLNRLLTQADVLAASSLLREDFRQHPENARVAALTLDQLGVPVTINTMNACYVIKGAVGMMTWLWCAVAQALGGHEVWLDEESNAECGIAHLRRSDTGAVRTVRFTIDDARRAGLLTGANKDTYDKWTTDMLGWRALSRVINRYAPEVKAGLAAAGAMPGPVLGDPQRGEFLVSEDVDDEIADGEVVEPDIPQGEDIVMPETATAPPGPGPDVDRDEWAEFVRWREAGAPRDEQGKPIPVHEPGETTAVDAPPAAPGRDPVPGEWRARAAELGFRDTTLLKEARRLALSLGVDQPASLDEVTDPRLVAAVEEWLG